MENDERIQSRIGEETEILVNEIVVEATTAGVAIGIETAVAVKRVESLVESAVEAIRRMTEDQGVIVIAIAVTVQGVIVAEVEVEAGIEIPVEEKRIGSEIGAIATEAEVEVGTEMMAKESLAESVIVETGIEVEAGIDMMITVIQIEGVIATTIERGSETVGKARTEIAIGIEVAKGVETTIGTAIMTAMGMSKRNVGVRISILANDQSRVRIRTMTAIHFGSFRTSASESSQRSSERNTFGKRVWLLT